MKFSCLQENFNRGISIVNKAVATKGALPVLSNILLEARKNGLKLSATDLETGIVTQVGAKVEKEGAVTVPARILSDFVSSLPPSTIEIAMENQILSLVSEKARSRIHGLAAEEFPPLPQAAAVSSFKIPAVEFANAVAQVVYAAATDESRPVLAGVLIRGGEGEKELVLAGVDGFRLAERRMPLAEPLPQRIDIVIPGRTLREVMRIAGADEGHLAIDIIDDDKQIVFSKADTVISARLLEGAFPDYNQIIPKSFVTKAIFNREELLQAIRLAAIFARDSASIVKLTLDSKEERLVLSANTQEVGDSAVTIEGRIEGSGGEIAFNSKYLTDCLSNLSDEEISFEMNETLNPGMIRPVGVDSYLHLVMPVRVQN